jgi:hypothetical protein
MWQDMMNNVLEAAKCKLELKSKDECHFPLEI